MRLPHCIWTAVILSKPSRVGPTNVVSGAQRYEFKLKHTGTHPVIYSTRISNAWLYVDAGRLTFSSSVRCPDIPRAVDDLLKDNQYVLPDEW